MRRKARYGLGELQAQVMDLIWERGEATVAQVAESLAQQRDVVYTTVLVAMQKLEKKGWLKHRTEGRAYVYRAARSRARTQTGLLSEVLDAVFGGDANTLISQLLDARSWTPDELAEMRRLIEARRKQSQKENRDE